MLQSIEHGSTAYHAIFIIAGTTTINVVSVVAGTVIFVVTEIISGRRAPIPLQVPMISKASVNRANQVYASTNLKIPHLENSTVKNNDKNCSDTHATPAMHHCNAA
jgi:hypothetical protein